ncbi:TPA: hypothetical protein JLU65_003066 [Escherichia coli]|nr:hypothetical protein [Escherichia coli]HAW0924989.1 hypothetical protein [Escherichia coli]HAW4333096.1 hypothetical protein [Escherichia coli]
METIFKIFERISSRPLYFIFLGLSLCEFFQNKSALQNPTAENIATLLAAMTIGVFITWGFEWLIFKFNANLEPYDQGDIAPTIGTAALAVYLVYALHFLGRNPEALNLKLLINSGFIYSTTLLLFSFESMKLRRLKQK